MRAGREQGWAGWIAGCASSRLPLNSGRQPCPARLPLAPPHTRPSIGPPTPPRLQALELCDRIGEVAEAEGHHPDLHLTGELRQGLPGLGSCMRGLAPNMQRRHWYGSQQQGACAMMRARVRAAGAHAGQALAFGQALIGRHLPLQLPALLCIHVAF